MNNKITKEEKIEEIIDLLKRSDYDYVDELYELIINNDLYSLPNVLMDEDWEALKTMIWNGDIE